MDDYQIAALVLGGFYSSIEFGKWIYNRTQQQEADRKLDAVHDIVTVRDSVGRPMVYRDTADQVALQKETVSEMRDAIRDLRGLVEDTNKMLQQFLIKELSR